MLATEKGFTDMVELLLEAKANVNQLNVVSKEEYNTFSCM
jgi:ankyrin repeat protein